MAAGAKKLDFVFKLVDRVSAPANKMTKALEKLEKAFGGTATAASKLSKSMGKSGLFVGSLGKTQKALAGVRKETGGWSMTLQGIHAGGSIVSSVASAATGAIGVFTGLAASIGKGVAKLELFALGAADFKEKSLIGFKTFLGGDPKKAQELFGAAMDFARKTPFETKDTIDLFNKLATAGFKFNRNSQGISEIEVAAKAIGDLASVRGGGTETINRVTMALAQIKSKGKLRSEELTGQLGEAGLQTGKVLDNIAKNLGKTRAQIDKMMQAGKIDADTGIFAIIQTLKETTSGGRLGGPMKELSHTIGGLWSTIKSAPFEMLVDLDKTKGFKSAKGFMENLATALNPKSSAGKKVKARVEQLMDDMLGFTFAGGAGSDGADKIAMFIDKALDVFQAGWNGIKTVVTSIVDETTKYLKELGGGDTGKGFKAFTDKIVSGIGKAADGLSKLVPAMTKVFELVISAAEAVGLIETKEVDTDEETSKVGKQLGMATPATDKLAQLGLADALIPSNWGTILELRTAAQKEQELVEKARQIGQNTGEGIVQGMLQKKEAAYQAGIEVANAAISGTETKLQVKSPSKVFEYFGLMTTKGFEEGLGKGSAATEAMIQNMLGLPGAETFGAQQPFTGPAPSRSISAGKIEVHVHVDGSGDPQATAEAVAQVLPEAIAEALEKLSLEQP